MIHEFINAQEMADRSPDTFVAPSGKKLNEIREGMFVKVSHDYERFWVEIINVRRDGTILGRVDNNLVFDHGFGLNDLVEFNRSNIYSISN